MQHSGKADIFQGHDLSAAIFGAQQLLQRTRASNAALAAEGARYEQQYEWCPHVERPGTYGVMDGEHHLPGGGIDGTNPPLDIDATRIPGSMGGRARVMRE